MTTQTETCLPVDDTIYQLLPEAKVGDLIQAYDVTALPVDKSRGSYLGTVTKVEIDRYDGIEYVHYTPICFLEGSSAQPLDVACPRSFRVPQNNTRVWVGGTRGGRVVTTDKIVVVTQPKTF